MWTAQLAPQGSVGSDTQVSTVSGLRMKIRPRSRLPRALRHIRQLDVFGPRLACCSFLLMVLFRLLLNLPPAGMTLVYGNAGALFSGMVGIIRKEL